MGLLFSAVSHNAGRHKAGRQTLFTAMAVAAALAAAMAVAVNTTAARVRLGQ